MTREADSPGRAARWLPAIALASFLIWILLLITGGFTWRIASHEINAHQRWPALAASVLAALLCLHPAIRATVPRVTASWWRALDDHGVRIANAAVALTLYVGISWGSFVAGGADSYGYVSQAHLWAKGDLRVYQPIAHQVSWSDADWTFSPLGYRPGRRSGYIVPTYSPGLPLLMAGALKVGGAQAVFYVVPLLGALTVWLTFALGRRADRAATGALAAILVATSPIVLFQLVQPMSDVPVTAWWTAALVAALRRDRRGAALSGLAASAAILTRPNLVPLAVPIAFYLLVSDVRSRSWRSRLATAAVFTLALTPGVAAVATINDRLYGSGLASGYGSLSEIYASEHVVSNVRRYTMWVLDSQTWFITLAALAPVIAWRPPRRADAPSRIRLADVLLFVSFAAVLFACYVGYLVFADWSYIRFLMPGLPIVMLLAVSVGLVMLSALPMFARAPAAMVLTTILAATYAVKADAHRTFTFARDDRHYVDAADYLTRAVPSRAVLLAVQESGTLRFYADLLTLRWDMVDPSRLDATLDELRQKGHPPYFVLESWEEADFRRRFEGHSALALLDWPPLADIGRYVRVRVYDPSSRAKYLAGEEVRTERIVAPDQ